MGSAKTTFSFSNDSVASAKVDGLIIPVFKKPATKNQNQKSAKKEADPTESILWSDALKQIDKAMAESLETLASEEKFDAGRGKMLVVRKGKADKFSARRVILVGMGETEKLNAKHWDLNVQKGISSALALKDAKTVAILLPGATDALPAETAVINAVDAAYQATYRSAESKDKSPELNKVIFLSKSGSNLNAVAKRGEVMARSRSMVKDLVNRPSNIKTTGTMVDSAKAVGKSGITVKVQTSTDWIRKNMPCFYTVAQGSVATDPPKFITLQYKPKSGRAKKHIAVVGKSVIFDTGGYQVKPGDYMVTMKGDMTGGAVALATMQALSELQPENIEVTAYLAATPNKIDSDAMIPDSVVDTTCGKKVEIRHTDAEGRLTLIDAVAKAVENKPDEIITIATLTGSASQAVGYTIALMGNNEDLVQRVNRAGKSLGEPIQTLDVTEDDYDAIKSKLDGADIINTSQRKHRGAQSAAAFVMSGAPEDMPMAHMDIAGADMTADEKATGISLKTIVQYLLDENNRLAGSRASAGTRPAAKASAAGTGAKKSAARNTRVRKTAPKSKTGKAASGRGKIGKKR